jgi:hypothetical protein
MWSATVDGEADYAQPAAPSGMIIDKGQVEWPTMRHGRPYAFIIRAALRLATYAINIKSM